MISISYNVGGKLLLEVNPHFTLNGFNEKIQVLIFFVT